MRVDFYLLSSSEPEALSILACSILEKAYHRGHKVYVHCNNQKEGEFLDELLWTFREDSFIPHNLIGEGPEPPPPIQIGWDKEPRGFNDILLNLSTGVPLFHTKFKRIIELVSNQEQEKEQSRAHYKEYKLKGYELKTYALDR